MYIELQIYKSKEGDGNDPGEVNSLKKRIAKLESDLKDKSDAFNRVSAELDQLKTSTEELKRRASVNTS